MNDDDKLENKKVNKYVNVRSIITFINIFIVFIFFIMCLSRVLVPNSKYTFTTNDVSKFIKINNMHTLVKQYPKYLIYVKKEDYNNFPTSNYFKEDVTKELPSSSDIYYVSSTSELGKQLNQENHKQLRSFSLLKNTAKMNNVYQYSKYKQYHIDKNRSEYANDFANIFSIIFLFYLIIELIIYSILEHYRRKVYKIRYFTVLFVMDLFYVMFLIGSLFSVFNYFIIALGNYIQYIR